MMIRFVYLGCGALLGLVGGFIVSTKGWLILSALLNPTYAVIWSGVISAIIAASIALFGVLAANRRSLELLNIQHANDTEAASAQRSHDAAQKEEDRKAAIRREVYTSAVEEAHAVLAVVGSLPDRPLSEHATDADGLQLFLKTNAKVWLVAESEAAFLSRELTSLMGELYIEALQAAHPLRLAMEPVRALERRMVHTESEIQRLATRRSEVQDRSGTVQERAATTQAWVNENAFLKTLTTERDRQRELIGPARFAYAEERFESLRLVQQAMVKLVSALRKELGLQPDEERFLVQLLDMESRARAALNRAFRIGAAAA